MSRWSIAEAKARLSELVEKATEEPQEITNRGRDVAVVVAKDDWDAMLAGRSAEARTPMQRFLELTEALKQKGDLTLRVPRRRPDSRKRSPFEE
jgi:prevent-host-death family protein